MNYFPHFTKHLILCTIIQYMIFTSINAQSKTYKLQNGQWFNGKSFVTRSMYVENGFFADKKPTRIDTIIDFNGKYVVPPFSEAHTHHLEGIGAPPHQLIDSYPVSYTHLDVYKRQISGTLILKGSTILANYETAIESIQYLNQSENLNISTKKICITVHDGSENSNQVIRELKIIPVNDCPSAIRDSLLITERCV